MPNPVQLEIKQLKKENLELKEIMMKLANHIKE